MEVLYDYVKKLKEVEIYSVISVILNDSTFRDWILDLIRYDQLYNRGIRGDGVSLGNYAPLSLELKIDPMLDHVTLKETGEFYSTFNIKVNASDFIIDGDASGKTILGLGDLFDVYDNSDGDLLGLTDENFQKVIDIFKEKILEQYDNIY